MQSRQVRSHKLIVPGLHHLVQRGQQALVLDLGADGDAQAFSQAVAAHRPQHHPTPDQPRLDARTVVAEFDQQEVGLRWRYLHAACTQRLRERLALHTVAGD